MLTSLPLIPCLQRHQQTWAEPDAVALAKLMQWAVTAREQLRAKADKAYRSVRERFSCESSAVSVLRAALHCFA